MPPDVPPEQPGQHGRYVAVRGKLKVRTRIPDEAFVGNPRAARGPATAPPLDGRPEIEPLVPLVVRPNVARQLLGGCSTEKLYQLIKSGRIKSYLDGAARMIVVASIRSYIADQVAAATPVDDARVEKAVASRLAKQRVRRSAAGGLPVEEHSTE
jgi:hypothetical protein